MDNSQSQSNANWPVCDPNLVLAELSRLSQDRCADGKVFFKTYTNYDKLTPANKNKVQSFFYKQSEEVRVQVNEAALAAAAQSANEETARAAITNKDDRYIYFSY